MERKGGRIGQGENLGHVFVDTNATKASANLLVALSWDGPFRFSPNFEEGF